MPSTYYAQDKGAYAPRSSSPRSTSSTYTSSTTSSSSLYAHSANSNRHNRYGSKPVTIHQGGQTSDPNTSTSTGNSGYYK